MLFKIPINIEISIRKFRAECHIGKKEGYMRKFGNIFSFN